MYRYSKLLIYFVIQNWKLIWRVNCRGKTFFSNQIKFSPEIHAPHYREKLFRYVTYFSCFARRANVQAAPLCVSIVMLHNFSFDCLFKLSIDIFLKWLVNSNNAQILFIYFVQFATWHSLTLMVYYNQDKGKGKR